MARGRGEKTVLGSTKVISWAVDRAGYVERTAERAHLFMEESTAGKNGRREERVLHTNGAGHVREARLGSVPRASRSQCTSTRCSPSHVPICEHMQVPAGTQIKAPLSSLPAPEPEHSPGNMNHPPSASLRGQHPHSCPTAGPASAPGQ